MLFQLPVELQHQCVRCLDNESLKCFRLVGRAALALATEALFHTLRFTPTRKDSKRLAGITSKENLRSLVRVLTLETDDWEEDWRYTFGSALPGLFERSGWDLTKFPGLREVQMNFSQECFSSKSTSVEGSLMDNLSSDQDCRSRTEFLTLLFGNMKRSRSQGAPLDSLVIKNLQDWTDDTVYESEDFSQVCIGLKKLALQIATEHDSYEEDRNVDLSGPHHCFNIDFPKRWLIPLQRQLTHLTICTARCYWGFYPFCDLRDIDFPNLRSLCLAKWTLFDDWQVSWLISHHRTLQELILHDCPIVAAVIMGHQSYVADLQHPRASPFSLNTPPGPRRVEEYALHWSNVFCSLETGLSSLTRFVLRHEHWDGSTMFEERYDLPCMSNKNRYMVLEHDLEMWVSLDDELQGRVYHFNNDHPNAPGEELSSYPCTEEDDNALLSFLGTVERRRTSTY